MKRIRGNKYTVKDDKEYFIKLFKENYEKLLLGVYYDMEERDLSKADAVVQQIFYEAYKQIKAIRRARDPKRKLYLIARKELQKADVKAENSSEEKSEDSSEEKQRGLRHRMFF